MTDLLTGERLTTNFPFLEDEPQYQEQNIEYVILQKTNKNYREFQSFITNVPVLNKGNDTANVIDVAKKRCHSLSLYQIEPFFYLMNKCREDQSPLHFLERQTNANTASSGIMLDFDIYQESNITQITPILCEKIANVFSTILIRFLNLTCETEFHMFFIKKPAVLPADKTNHPPPVYKDGIHILVPDVWLTKSQKKQLYDHLLKSAVFNKIMSRVKCLDPLDKVLDIGSIRNPVHFFGNCKKSNQPGPVTPYTLFYVSHTTFDPDDDFINTNKLDPIPILKGIHPNPEITKPINLCYELSLSFSVESFRGNPVWLQKKRYQDGKSSLASLKQSVKPKITNEAAESKDSCTSDIDSIEDYTSSEIQEEVKFIKDILNILPDKYYDDYILWFKVLCCLYNIGPEYKQVALWFSQKSDTKFSVEGFERVWDSITKTDCESPLTKGSLVYWARMESPRRYNELVQSSNNLHLKLHAFENDGKIPHTPIARILHKLLQTKFIVAVDPACTNTTMNYRWYEFVTPGIKMLKGQVWKWRMEQIPDNLHIFIADYMPNLYQTILDVVEERISNAITNGGDKGIITYYKTVKKNLKASQSRLSDDAYQRSVINQARFRFRCRNFLEELDNYEDILGVGNGVLKIGREPKLYDCYHEWRISKYTEIDYEPYDPNNPYIQELIQAFTDIFIEPDVLEFMLYHAATGLDARESSGLLLLLVGGGSNGKTFFVKMIHNVLGNKYCSAGKPSLLIAPSESSESANSALMQVAGKRYFYFDEFNKCEALNVARVKSLINPGIQSGRELYQQQTNFKTTATISALSNHDFIINDVDHGTWRRIYYYRNKIKFTKNPDPTNPYEKQDNPDFIYKLCHNANYRKAMLSLMTFYYQLLWVKYNGEIKKVPVPTIDQETLVFRNKQDKLNIFLTQRFVISPNADVIVLRDIARYYREWKERTESLDNIIPQLENSIISRFIVPGNSRNNLIVTSLRYLNQENEPLNPGESYLTYINHRS